MLAIRGALLVGTSIALALTAVQKDFDAAPQNPPQQEIEVLGRQFTQQIQPAGRQPDESLSPRTRYQKLLRTIPAPGDRNTYGDFCDFGYWSGTSYGGQTGLPRGYWVYLAPNWYVYQQSDSAPVAAPNASRPWGAEQATGKPDTWPQSGDLQTAWASKTPDGQREWLELTYASPVRPAAAMIYETYNPGAVDRVTGYDAAGKEVELWSGADPTPAGKAKGISVIPLHPDFDLTRIRIYLDSQKVAGWNEIDAVGLLDETGKAHWAKSAAASSTYADTIGSAPEIEPLTVPSQRIRKLEAPDMKQ